jgi:hypothetical protein
MFVDSKNDSRMALLVFFFLVMKGFIKLSQGGQTVLFTRTKDIFPVVTRGKETPPGAIF